MADEKVSDRTRAPAYLHRYLERRREGPAEPEPTPSNDPPYLQRARARARERADRELQREEPPPGGRSEGYARVTVSPREIVPPPRFQRRLQGAVECRLIRHGQTQGYATDAGLTALGQWQAHRKGQGMARGIQDGARVRFLCAPTARATETARRVHEGLVQGLARYAIDATVEEPIPDARFRNFQVWVDGREQDVTQAFMHFATLLEDHERHKGGDRPGWLTEMERFWNIQAAGGDPITHWLRMPLQYFEPAAICVRRFWMGILAAIEASPDDLQRLLVCTHSGPIRAVATAAVGHDPGEPYHTEDVRLRVFDDREHAVVTFRERGVEIEIPATDRPPWDCRRESR